jgi:hypothetical protein
MRMKTHLICGRHEGNGVISRVNLISRGWNLVLIMEAVAPPTLDIYKQITNKLKKRYAY